MKDTERLLDDQRVENVTGDDGGIIARISRAAKTDGECQLVLR